MLVESSVIKSIIVCPSNITLKGILQSYYATAADLRISMKCFEGEHRVYTHYSDVTKCKMSIGVYLPPKAIIEKMDCPVLYFLSGQYSTHAKFMEQSGFNRYAAQLGLCVVCPDTSPRNVADPKHPILGPGCSFFMDAEQKPWSKHYKMYSYITKELIDVTNQNFGVLRDKQSICGYSMGAYGALIAYLRNPGLYKSISVFAPAIDPVTHPILRLALSDYIGKDKETWKPWDPNWLAVNYSHDPIEIFIDQGSIDEYTDGMPETFIQWVKNSKNSRVKIIYKKRMEYNHSYFYVSTFLEEHMNYHARFLNCEC